MRYKTVTKTEDGGLLKDPKPPEDIDFTARIRCLRIAEDFDFTDTDIERINRYLNIYTRAVSADKTDKKRNRGESEKSHEILAALSKALDTATSAFEAVEGNRYCKAAILDALEYSDMSDENSDTSIALFNQDVETLKRLSKIIEQAWKSEKQSNRVPVISRGRPAEPGSAAFDTLLAQLYEACIDIVLRTPNEELDKARQPSKEITQRENALLNEFNLRKRDAGPQEKERLTAEYETAKDELKNKRKSKSLDPQFQKIRQEVESERKRQLKNGAPMLIVEMLEELVSLTDRKPNKNRIQKRLSELNPDRLPAAAIHTGFQKIVREGSNGKNEVDFITQNQPKA